MRINHDYRNTFLLSLNHAAPGKRVGLDSVGTPHNDQVSIQYIFEWVGGCTGPERERETCN